MAGDSQDALREVERTQPDLVLVDISLKSGNGLELCKQIRVRFPETKVLVELALEAGGPDNVTAIVARYRVFPRPD